MPEIARFFGMIVTMYFKEHGVPHFHVRYESHRASVEIESGEIHGKLPPRAVKLVEEWRLLHRAELLANWQAARTNQMLNKIAPLE